MSVRVRFAPSPTGFLHIGSLRTALFTYLTAKSQGGTCILRIEDTDQQRLVEGATESLIGTLAWVGITFDEGPHVGGAYGPYIQTERLHIYQEYVKILLEKGEAYRCFCTPERLEAMRKEQQSKKLPTQYDRQCRTMPAEEAQKRADAGERFVIRQKMPLEGEVTVYDELRGEIRFRAPILDDHVLVKSNGIPTYQFANVIDDHLMEISHVTRAEEWIPSFPKNMLLYKAFGWEPPKFVHFPVILNKGGGKLSKRHGDVMVEDYREQGYLPEALVNFCVLLGWHPKDDVEILSQQDIEGGFRYEDIGTSPAIFDLEKLDYFNGYYIRKKTPDALLDLCLPYLTAAGLVRTAGDPGYEICKSGEMTDRAYLRNVVALERERLKKLSHIPDMVDFFFTAKLEYEPDLLVWKKMDRGDARSNLRTITGLLESISEGEWTFERLEGVMTGFLQTNKLNVGSYLWPFRVSLTGRRASPGGFEVAGVLGKRETLGRIEAAIEML